MAVKDGEGGREGGRRGNEELPLPRKVGHGPPDLDRRRGGMGRFGRLELDTGRKKTEWRVHYSDRSESGGGGVVYWRQIETAERRIARWKVRGAKGNEHLPSFLPPRCDRKTAWLLSPAS